MRERIKVGDGVRIVDPYCSSLPYSFKDKIGVVLNSIGKIKTIRLLSMQHGSTVITVRRASIVKHDVVKEDKFGDIKAVLKAAEIDETLSEIDEMWKSRLYREKQREVRFPFGIEEDYNMRIFNKGVLIEGYKGDLAINKLVKARRQFAIKDPIVIKDFTVYGRFSQKGDFARFLVEPGYGFHLTGMTNSGGNSICYGNEIKMTDITYSSFKDKCKEIFFRLSFINMDSLASARIPEDHWMAKEKWGEIGEMIEKGRYTEMFPGRNRKKQSKVNPSEVNPF